MFRKYTLALLAGMLGLTALAAGAVLVIDPAFQYHKPLNGLCIAYENERYQNAGFAKNFEYDTVVMGSSLTSTFETTWFDEQFDCQSVKLSFPGGTFADFDMALATAFTATPDIERVFISLDPRLLKNSPASTGEMPDYLWDFNPWNDVQYLLNKDVLAKLCLPSLLQTLHGDYIPVEQAFVRDHVYEYGLQKSIASYVRPPVSDEQLPADAYDAGLQAHWDILDGWLTSYPDTTFYFYLPPYPTLFWDTVIREGEVEPMLALIENTAKRYMHQPNVRFYSFLDDNPITTNYDNYTDMVHYSPAINKLLVERMATEAPLDDTSLAKAMNDMKSLVIRYDFESLFPDNYENIEQAPSLD